MKEHSQFFREERGQAPPQGKARSETQWSYTTVERDAFGNIHVRTRNKGGQEAASKTGRTTYSGPEDIGSNMNFQNLWRNRDNIKRAFSDPWQILEESMRSKKFKNDERPTILDFPRSFTIVQPISATEGFSEFRISSKNIKLVNLSTLEII
uniref:Uncharacterized protein n=1 Tax=Arcella intermedia TaxID=1963864 RepID=A0A6B2LBV1_9EUKA